MITTMMGVIIVIIILALLMIFGVRNDQKVSHNMILMSKYKGQLHGEKGSKHSGRGLPPAPFRAMHERKIFLQEVFPYIIRMHLGLNCRACMFQRNLVITNVPMPICVYSRLFLLSSKRNPKPFLIGDFKSF